MTAVRSSKSLEEPSISNPDLLLVPTYLRLMMQAEELLRKHLRYALPVVGQEGDQADKLLGLITRTEISKAFRVRPRRYPRHAILAYS